MAIGAQAMPEPGSCLKRISLPIAALLTAMDAENPVPLGAENQRPCAWLAERATQEKGFARKKIDVHAHQFPS